MLTHTCRLNLPLSWRRHANVRLHHKFPQLLTKSSIHCEDRCRQLRNPLSTCPYSQTFRYFKTLSRLSHSPSGPSRFTGPERWKHPRFIVALDIIKVSKGVPYIFHESEDKVIFCSFTVPPTNCINANTKICILANKAPVGFLNCDNFFSLQKVSYQLIQSA